jgi:hypothetical protein
MSFHHTEWKPTKDAGPAETFNAGDVIKLFNYAAFGDAVILGFDDFGQVKLSRPYAYVSCAGTTGPTTLMGYEVGVYPCKSLIDHYRRIEEGRVT